MNLGWWTRTMSEGLKLNTPQLMQTTEEVERAFIVAASAATTQSTRPSRFNPMEKRVAGQCCSKKF
jgi:hypothetical protein